MKRNKRSPCTRGNSATPYHRNTNIENRSDAQASTSANRPGFKFISNNLLNNTRFQHSPYKFQTFICQYIGPLTRHVTNPEYPCLSLKRILEIIIIKSKLYICTHPSSSGKSNIHIKQEEYTAKFLKDIIYFTLDVFFKSNPNIKKNDLQDCELQVMRRTYTFRDDVTWIFNDYINTVLNSLKNDDKPLYDSLSGDAVVSHLLIEKNNRCFDRFDINKRSYRMFNMGVDDKRSFAEFIRHLISIVHDNAVVVEEDRLFEHMYCVISNIMSSDKVDCIYPIPDIFEVTKCFFDNAINNKRGSPATSLANTHKFVRVVSLITCQLNKIEILKFSIEGLKEFLEQKDKILNNVVDNKFRDPRLIFGEVGKGKKQVFISMIYAEYMIQFCRLLLDIQGEVNQDKINEASKASAKFVDCVIDELAKEACIPENGRILYYSTIPKILSFFNKHEISQKQPALPVHFHESPSEDIDDVYASTSNDYGYGQTQQPSISQPVLPENYGYNNTNTDYIDGIIGELLGFNANNNMTQLQLTHGANDISDGGVYASTSNDYGYGQTQQPSISQPVLPENYRYNNTNNGISGGGVYASTSNDYGYGQIQQPSISQPVLPENYGYNNTNNGISGGGVYASTSNDYGYGQIQQPSMQPILLQNDEHNSANINGFVDLNASNNMIQQQLETGDHYISDDVYASTSNDYGYVQTQQPSISQPVLPQNYGYNNTNNGISGGGASSTSNDYGYVQTQQPSISQPVLSQFYAHNSTNITTSVNRYFL